MIKQLILLFHVFGVFFYQIIFSGDITVSQQLPSTMQAGSEVVVEIIVHKNDVTGFAKVQQEIPQGFSVEEIDTKGATFSFKENKVKFIWMSLPSDEEFTISYKLKSDAALTGDYTFGGKFSFITNSERKNIEIAKATISVTGEEVADTESNPEEVETNPTTKENDPIEAALIIPVTSNTIKLITVKCDRTITEIEPGKFSVLIKIKKDGVEGFAKIGEKIPNGFTANEINSNGGVFSFKEQTAKILWMAIPKGEEIEISYQLTSDKGTENSEYRINGDFSYLDNDVTSKYSINQSSFDLILPETIDEVVAITNPEKNDPAIEEEKPIETDEEATPEKRVTSTPSSENGVTYKIQVGAGHKTVSSKYFANKFNLQDNVSTMNHEGWIKYLVGNYTEYKAARDKRETVKAKINTAFVTAYNTGKRITVQEALMISNQKWYK